jgi:hypothetical protein
MKQRLEGLAQKKSERATIAEKLFQGIPNHRILEDIGKTFNADDRFSFTTNRDIHNPKKAFNVQSDVIFHSHDDNSVGYYLKNFTSFMKILFWLRN